MAEVNNNNTHAILRQPNADDAEEILLSDADLEELSVTEPKLKAKKASEPSTEVAEAMKEVHKAIDQVKTGIDGIANSEFLRPLHESGIISADFKAVSGNEEGSVEGVMENMPYYAVTINGGKEDANDDAFLIDPSTNTVIVMDGLGGYEGGFVASTLAAYRAAKILEKSRYGIFHPDLKKMLRLMHETILEFQNKNPNFQEMGATAVIAHQRDIEHVEFVHAGDSRAMVIRNGKKVFSTKDDNYLQVYMEKNKDKIETEEQARAALGEMLYKKYRSMVTQSLGVGNTDTETFKQNRESVIANFEKYDTQKGDIVVLCSDGVTDNLTNEEILGLFMEQIEMGKSLKKAVEKVKEVTYKIMGFQGGKADNIVIAAYIVE